MNGIECRLFVADTNSIMGNFNWCTVISIENPFFNYMNQKEVIEFSGKNRFDYTTVERGVLQTKSILLHSNLFILKMR